MVNKLVKHPRIKVLNKSLSVEWSRDTILKAEILLLNESIKDEMDYFIYLSGQDLIIKNDLYHKKKGLLLILIL